MCIAKNASQVVVIYGSRPIDDMSLSYANVISELVLVRDGMLSLTDSHFSAAVLLSFLYCLIGFSFFCTSSANK